MLDIVGDKNANKIYPTSFRNTRSKIANRNKKNTKEGTQRHLNRLEAFIHAVKLQTLKKRMQHIMENAPAQNIHICDQNAVNNA